MPFPWQELKVSEFAAHADYAQGFPTNSRSASRSAS